MIVEVTPPLAGRGSVIWAPLGEEAMARLARMPVDELEGVIEFFRYSIDLNQRHIERVRDLELP